ncbi:MAG TPA: tetratricopeptide repeat protein [bacterium]|jgi:serine/threonine protein kinase/tetratricopeptide (TPR) repeat protein
MASADLFASRYNILRRIGSGGMGEVCLVEDTLRDNKIMALKTMKNPGDEAAAEGFRAEFRNVHGVVHPNIPEVFDFGVLPPPNRQLFFTCEFVDGKPLDTLAQTWSPAQLHVILVRLCRALSFLHSRGLLHRDIKAQNILGRLEADGQIALLKLVDFGLAAMRGQGTEAAGTIEYMAPEIIGGNEATVASDIYAAGMLLYQLACGRLPFDNDDPLAAAKVRCTAEAPSPLRFRPDLPVGLSDVISALIRIKPEERPASARRVIALLNEREGTDFPFETPESRTAYIRSASVVSNSEARAVLQWQCTELTKGGVPPAVLIHAATGLGRSRLVRDFVSELTLQGIRSRLVNSDADLVADDLPQVLAIPNADAMAQGKLAMLLGAARESGTWCIVGMTREDAELTALLGPYASITLRPLDREGVQDFVNATFPENTFPAEFAENLYSRSLGFPVAIQRMLDGLLESEQLQIGLSGWELMVAGHWNFPVDPSVARHIATAYATLSEAAQWLMCGLTCSRTPLPESVLAAFMACSTEDPQALSAALSAVEHLGWIQSGAEGWSLRFTALADHLDESFSAARRCSIHEALTLGWSSEELAEHPHRKRELLYHDFYAGTWKTPAAEAEATLRDALENDDVRWVRRLIEGCLDHHPPADLWAVMLDALVQVEYVEGNVEASSARLGLLLDNGKALVSEENLEKMARYGMFEEKLGRVERSQQILERCLEVLPAGHDSRAGMIFGTLAWIAFKGGEAEKARRLAEEGLVRIPPQSADSGQALLLNTVATLAFYRGDNESAALFWKRCLEVNEAIHDRKGIANMYNNLGVLAAQSGDRLRSRSLWQKCGELSREINDLHRLAGINNNLGIDSLETGQLPEAEEYYLKSLALFRRMKSPREQVEILSNLGELAYYRADYSRAQSYLQEAVSLAETLNDHEAEVEPLVYLGKLMLALEQLDKAETALERARQFAGEVEAKKGEGQAWEGLAVLHSRRGEMEQAEQALEHAHAVLSEDIDPLAVLHLYLTECAIAAERNNGSAVQASLGEARKIADIKWDPFTAARTLVYGLLFAGESVDVRERPRVLRQLSVYPEFLWRLHWATARRLTSEGAARKALDEYGRGVSVLKAVASRLPEDSRNLFLNSPQISQFKAEAVSIRNTLKGNG